MRRFVIPFGENITQHHVVSVHPISVNPYDAFVLDTWNSWYGKDKDITGETTVKAWKRKYLFDHYEMRTNAEVIDEMNRETAAKTKLNQKSGKRLEKRKN